MGGFECWELFDIPLKIIDWLNVFITSYVCQRNLHVSPSFQLFLCLHKIVCLRIFQHSVSLHLFPFEQNFMLWSELQVLVLIPGQSLVLKVSQDVSVLIMIGRESFNVTFVTDDDQRFGVHKCMHSFQTDSLKWMLWTSLPDYFSHCILIYCQAQAKLQLQLAWVEPYSQCFSPPTHPPTHPTGKVLPGQA